MGRKISQEEALRIAKKIHGDKYDYSKYARENGYNLLRIPYWKVDEIEGLLLKFF